jgi:HPt (histidine-containing phosphotransfer) domain-containing protein
MTAHAIGPDVDQALGEGMNGHIAKPFDPDNLLATILRHLPTSSPAVVRAPDHKAPTDRRAGHLENNLPAAILSLPGLDQAALARRFAGKTAFLLRLLNNFANDFEGFAVGLEGSLARNDRETVARQLHSLKGLAATFGLTRLQQKALAAETEFSAEGKLAAALQFELTHELKTVLTAIKQTQAVGEPALIVQDAQQIQRLLKDLQQHLASADGQVELLWSNNKSIFASIFSPPELAQIERAINHWDFDQALDVLLRSTAKNKSKI